MLDCSKRPTLDEILADPFMTTDPIPKTMPRSTLACPPSKNFYDQLKANTSNSQTNSQARLPSQLRDSEAEKKGSLVRNDSGEKGFASRGSGKLEGFGSSGSNFRPESKDAKGGQQSTKNLGNVNSAAYQTLQKKGK